MIFKDNEQCKNQDIILGRVINSQIRDSFAKKTCALGTRFVISRKLMGGQYLVLFPKHINRICSKMGDSACCDVMNEREGLRSHSDNI